MSRSCKLGSTRCVSPWGPKASRRPNCWSLLLAIALLVVGVGGCSSPDPAAFIQYTSEVVLPGVVAKPNAIARMPNGDFVVAGTIGAGWAAATDAHGKLLWQYLVPREERPPYSTSSEFLDVVPLANGNVLLCGTIYQYHPPQENGYLVILDAAGHLVEERRLFPKDDRQYFGNVFNDCVSWNDGVAVIGHTTAQPMRGYGWITKLDGTGRKLWELIDEHVGGLKAVAMPYGLVTSGVELSLVSPEGKLTVHRALDDSVNLLRPLQPDGVVRFITYRPEGATLHLLDRNLAELQVHKIGYVRIQQGVGYVLRDNSIALFGNVHLPDGTFTAAVGHFTSQGAALAERTIGVRNGAVTVRDALSLTGNDFVAVRDQTTDAQHVVLTWITLK